MTHKLSSRRSESTSDSPALPEAGRYEIDPTHSAVEFVARHLMVAKVRGRFTAFSGAITIGSTLGESSVEIELETGSVDTGVPDRDDHLRSNDFFNSEMFPTATFRSVAVESLGGHHYAVEGELTIAGTTLPVTLDLAYSGALIDPWGKTRAIFSATTQLDREAFGLTWNQALEAGGMLIGKTIGLEIEVQAVHVDD